eukprot:SAG22_NODE_8988_length_616_cov_0.990329_1_plen_125_part_10
MSFACRAASSLGRPACRAALRKTALGASLAAPRQLMHQHRFRVVSAGSRAFTINYTVPERATKYSQVTTDDLAVFCEILGENAVIAGDVGRADKYNTDWTGKHTGQAPAVLLPRTTEQVSAIMKH